MFEPFYINVRPSSVGSPAILGCDQIGRTFSDSPDLDAISVGAGPLTIEAGKEHRLYYRFASSIKEILGFTLFGKIIDSFIRTLLAGHRGFGIEMFFIINDETHTLDLNELTYANQNELILQLIGQTHFLGGGSSSLNPFTSSIIYKAPDEIGFYALNDFTLPPVALPSDRTLAGLVLKASVNITAANTAGLQLSISHWPKCEIHLP